MRTGMAQLPLHGGKAPPWLFSRMKRLAREMICHIIADRGPGEVLARLSDPFWFQAFGCVLGFDWHSSGVTTTTCGAVKEGIRGLEHELGLYAAGGKGAVSRRTPEEITLTCEKLSRSPQQLVYASRLSAKVDNAALQDGHQLYHHSFFFTGEGHWCVVQQGMSDASGSARRYHWLGEKVSSFVNEPHAAVCSNGTAPTLNLIAGDSAATRQAITEISGQGEREVARALAHLPNLVMPQRHHITAADLNPRFLKKVLLNTYENPPADFQALLGVQGIGAKSLRALALVSELIYGTRASTHDPARFSFAHGGKDGTPFAVDRQTYDRTIELLHQALLHAKVERSDKIKAFKRLACISGPAR